MKKKKIKKMPPKTEHRKKQINERQKKVLSNLSANSGKSMGRAMIQAGYSKSYAKNVKHFTKAPTWQNLIEKYLPDDLLLKTNEGLIKHKRDWRARDAGLDKAYKVRGKYAPEQVEIIKRKFGNMTNAELAEAIKKAKNFLIKK